MSTSNFANQTNSAKTELANLSRGGTDQRRELIRRLGSSTFNYWFGYVANISLVVWMAGHALPGGRSALGPVAFTVCATVGLLSWTLSEFLLHRYVYHVWQSFLSVGHGLHHRRPRDLIGVPWYLTTMAVIVLFEALTAVLPPAPTSVVLAFNWLGYVGYCIAHHASHHWNIRRGWLMRMKVHHLIHHRHPEFNWGFTTTFWDTLFGTAYKLPPPRTTPPSFRSTPATPRLLSRGNRPAPSARDSL